MIAQEHSLSSTFNAEDTLHIYVAQYLYHTGLILPVVTDVHDWRTTFPCLKTSQYAEFGWGDSTFFMAGNVNTAMALNALFFSKASVIGVIGLDNPPFFTEPFSMQRISLSARNYAALVSNLHAMTLQKQDSAIFLRDGFWGNRSAFYAANMRHTGQYSLLRNCNVWSAECLRMAGVETPLWCGLPQPLQWMLARAR
jgi:uncharacterized protein (TIGR02117 family)